MCLQVERSSEHRRRFQHRPHCGVGVEELPATQQLLPTPLLEFFPVDLSAHNWFLHHSWFWTPPPLCAGGGGGGLGQEVFPVSCLPKHQSFTQASQVALVVKNLPDNAGDIGDSGSIPGSGRSPGGWHGNPFQYSCLENPMDRGAWQATVHRVAKNWT